MTEAALLATIHRSGQLNQRELAEELSVGRAAAGQFIDRLEARGLVQRQSHPADRRVWLVTTTKEGRPVAEAANEIYLRTVADLVEGLAEADRDELLRAVLALQASAQHIAVEQSSSGP